MTKHLSALILALCAALPMQQAVAQSASTSSSSVLPAADISLYKSLGEKAGLVKLMDDFMVRLVADERTAPFFKPSNQTRVKEQLVEQFCQVSGGPCVYKGGGMKPIHAGFSINAGHFNALVEILQQSMDAQGIAFSAQNQLLAQLAPMHRDVITVK